jgi:hypothetical protein
VRSQKVWGCVAVSRAMLRQVAQRLACSARRGLGTSAICREGDKGPEGKAFVNFSCRDLRCGRPVLQSVETQNQLTFSFWVAES